MMAWTAKAKASRTPASHEATVEDGNDGREDRGRGQSAWVKILIGEIDGDAGNR